MSVGATDAGRVFLYDADGTFTDGWDYATVASLVAAAGEKTILPLPVLLVGQCMPNDDSISARYCSKARPARPYPQQP